MLRGLTDRRQDKMKWLALKVDASERTRDREPVHEAEMEDMEGKPALRAFVVVPILAVGVVSTSMAAVGKPKLVDTMWVSDADKDCFIMQLELQSSGTALMGVTTLEVLEGKWKQTGTAISATVYLDEKHPPLVFKGVYGGDRIQASYTWNEGSDSGPDKEQCEFQRGKK